MIGFVLGDVRSGFNGAMTLRSWRVEEYNDRGDLMLILASMGP